MHVCIYIHIWELKCLCVHMHVRIIVCVCVCVCVCVSPHPPPPPPLPGLGIRTGVYTYTYENSSVCAFIFMCALSPGHQDGGSRGLFKDFFFFRRSYAPAYDLLVAFLKTSFHLTTDSGLAQDYMSEGTKKKEKKEVKKDWLRVGAGLHVRG